MKKLKVWQLVLGLLLVVGGTALFIVAVSGGFGLGDLKASVEQEYQCEEKCERNFIELTTPDYERMIAEKKSFVVFVDQGGCTTADRLRGYVLDFANDKGFKVFRMMFDDMKKTSLHDFVKYYPSVAIISRGKVIGFLRADSDEDSDAYNKYDAFEIWMRKYLNF